MMLDSGAPWLKQQNQAIGRIRVLMAKRRKSGSTGSEIMKIILPT